jgi:hypothetical protein
MSRVFRPNSTIYIVFNPHDAKIYDESESDTEAYELYLDPRNIPEGREVHVYEVKGKGKIQPRTLILEGQ